MMSEQIQMLPIAEGCEELGAFCERFIREVAETLGVTYDQLVEDCRKDLFSEGLL